MQIEAIIDVQLLLLYEIIPYGSFQYLYYNLQDSVNLSKKGTLLNNFLYGVQNFIQNADVIYATLKQKKININYFSNHQCNLHCCKLQAPGA